MLHPFFPSSLTINEHDRHSGLHPLGMQVSLHTIHACLSYSMLPQMICITECTSRGFRLILNNRHFQSGGTGDARAQYKPKLNTIFDKHRDAPSASPDQISMGGTQEYFEAIGVQLTDMSWIIASEIMQCPTMGEITREGFVNGWAEKGCDTLDKQKQYVAQLQRDLPSSPDLHKRLYTYSFSLAKPSDQKSVQLDTALEFWTLLFSPPSPVVWRTNKTPWLDMWQEFVQEKFKKSVPKDTWVQLLKFAQESLRDESLSWWVEEESAYPAVIDEFIGWVKEKRGGDGEEMEVE